jgi:hypothetical protein
MLQIFKVVEGQGMSTVNVVDQFQSTLHDSTDFANKIQIAQMK